MLELSLSLPLSLAKLSLALSLANLNRHLFFASSRVALWLLPWRWRVSNAASSKAENKFEHIWLWLKN